MAAKRRVQSLMDAVISLTAGAILVGTVWAQTRLSLAPVGAPAHAALPPPGEPLPFHEVGVASWYGDPYHGRRTANGEVYDMFQLTAAHRTLPLPTYLRVTNLENRRAVVVRVNDRGPFIDGRIVDVSYEAARALGFVDKGLVRVLLEQVLPPP